MDYDMGRRISIISATKMPEVATETTAGFLLASESVTIATTLAVEPFGRTTPEELGAALMVFVPITATTDSEVGRIAACAVDFDVAPPPATRAVEKMMFTEQKT